MKEYQILFQKNKSRKTASDLKLKKTFQSINQQRQLNNINNSLKFKPPKLTPIVGQITIIPLKPQSGIVKQMLLGKQAMKIQGQIRKFRKIQDVQKKYVRTQEGQVERQVFDGKERNFQSSRGIKNPQIKRPQQSLLATLSQLKQSLKTKTPMNSSISAQITTNTNTKTNIGSTTTTVTTTTITTITTNIKNLPKLPIQQKYKAQKIQFPLLSSLDSNIRNIKSLHYFVLQHQTKIPVIAYRSKTKIQVASLTKIMTFYTVFKIMEEFNINPKEIQIPIQYDMTDISGTTALLEENQVYTLEQLLYGLMLPSGNDAALALAIWGGRKLKSIAEAKTNNPLKQFVEKMNNQAKQLKMMDTSYGNPHGLPHRNNKTTCQDVAKLCSKCLEIPLFRQVVGTKVYKFKFYHSVFKKKMTSHWENTNKLLRRPGFIGIKTGITVTAGPCLASAYQFLGKTYIVIIAKSSKPSRRFKQTRKLLVHCLQRIDHGRQLQKQQQVILKKLGRANEDIDSDYSDDEHQFDFSSFSPEEIKRRARILTQL